MPAPRSTGAGKLPRNPEVQQRRGAPQSGASWEALAAAAAREGDAASSKGLPLPAWPEEAALEEPGPGHSCGCQRRAVHPGHEPAASHRTYVNQEPPPQITAAQGSPP